MNILPLYAISSFFLCAVSLPARSAEQSTKPVITEGSYIGYATVSDALATLKSQGLTALPGLNGGVFFVEPDDRTTWTFAGKDDPAYPSAVRYIYTRSGGVLHAELTILCEASAERCEKFRSDIRDNVTQVFKMMAGDPSVKCWVNDSTMKCGSEPVRRLTNQHIYVQVADDGSCTIGAVAIPCLDIGAKIRSEHPSDDPNIAVCASAKAKYDVVGKVLNVITEDHLSAAFGCPPQ